MRSEKGFTLIELLIVVALLGIMAGMASLSFDFVKKQRLSASTREFLADIHTTRNNALTKSTSGIHSRGFGLRVISPTSYLVFEFDDADDGFDYDGAGEEFGSSQKNLASGVTIKRKSGGVLVDPNSDDGDIVIFDKRGLTRSSNWSSVGGTTFVFQSSGISPSKCVVVSQARIREGNWNESTSECDPF